MHKEYTDQIGGLYSRHCADIKNKPPELPQSGLCLLLKKRGGGAYFQEDTDIVKLDILDGIKFGGWKHPSLTITLKFVTPHQSLIVQ